MNSHRLYLMKRKEFFYLELKLTPTEKGDINRRAASPVSIPIHREVFGSYDELHVRL